MRGTLQGAVLRSILGAVAVIVLCVAVIGLGTAGAGVGDTTSDHPSPSGEAAPSAGTDSIAPTGTDRINGTVDRAGPGSGTASAGPDVSGGPVAPDIPRDPAVTVPASEQPLADAGLDQTVPLETTVYLDGGGSVAPDGTLVDYEWEIERPDGTTAMPDCIGATCVRASFLPSQVGVYDVTLTVTDGSGRTAQDTLYVTVTNKDGPSVSLTGPNELEVDEPGTFQLSATPGDAPLSSIAWLIDGDRHASSFVDGGTEWETTLTFDDPGTYTVSGLVTDLIGLTGEDGHTVTVEPEEEPFFAVTITGTNSPVAQGETLTVDATVTNTGDVQASQEVTADVEFGGSDAAAEVGPLDPGESSELTFDFDTDGVAEGQYEATVASADDADQTLVTVGTDATIEVTEILPSQPESVDDGYEFEVTVENTGETDAQSIVELRAVGDQEVIGATLTDDLAPGETASLPVEEFVWSGDADGWHQYDGETINVRATTDTWEGNKWRSIDVPQLPTFELQMEPDAVEATGSGTDSVSQVRVSEATITNTGDLEGRAEALFILEDSLKSEDVGVRDRLSDDSRGIDYRSIGPGESYTVDTYVSGETELYYNPQGSADKRDDVNVSVTVLSERTGKIHDSDEFDLFWNRWDAGGGGGPCETGEPELSVINLPNKPEGVPVALTVKLYKCEDGNPVERTLSPSEYTVEYHAAGSVGPPQYFSVHDNGGAVSGSLPIEDDRDYIEYAWNVYHKDSSAHGAGGALWYAPEAWPPE